jgi:pilus assembly protein CpaC
MKTLACGWAVFAPAIVLAVASATNFATLALAQAESPNDLMVAVGKSVLVTSDQTIERISMGYGDVADASAVGPNELVVNGIAPGSTSLIVFQHGGGKLIFDVEVQPNRFLANARLDEVRREFKTALPNQEITVTMESDSVFLRGTAKDLVSVNRAITIASTLGKVVNLLYVNVPAHEPQILLKVRFLSIDRNLSTQLGMNLFSTGAGNTVGSVTTGQFSPPTLPTGTTQTTVGAPFTFDSLLNIFLFRQDLNLGAVIQALQQKGVAEVLSEPNLLTENGRQGSFLAGGEFPIPVVQGGSGGVGAAITIQFKEFGIRLNFIPTIMPSGSIRLQVAPEVSSLDYTNQLTISGFSIPALITRKVKTDVELDQGQSFAIGGLLDKRTTDTFEKVPFLGDIPVLGKFFQSKSTNRTNTELVVIVTPELVQPMPASAPPMGLPFPKEFLEADPETAVRTPEVAATGTPVPTPVRTVPAETLMESLRPEEPLDISGSIGGKTAGSTAQSGSASQSPISPSAPLAMPPAALQQ